MAKTSMKVKQQRAPKFSTRAYTRCTICGRPQILQRLYSLLENLALRCCLIFIDVLAMKNPPNYFLNGIPNKVNNSRASSSVFAVVTKMMSIPLTLSTLSYSISGKINCSLIPNA